MKHNNINKYYKQINEFLLSLQDEKPTDKFKRNYCYFFTNKNNENLSICAEFIDTEKYYGISPALNIRYVLNDMKNHVFSLKTNEFDKKVNEYVRKYWNETSLDNFTLKQKSALMARALINIYSCFKDSKDKCVLKENIDALYNGVNNRLVEVKADYFEVSGKINYITFKLQRTTYFTTKAFKKIKTEDYNKTIDALISKYNETLQEIDKYETECFDKLKKELNACPDQEESIIALNNYLKESKHTHYINVSANITSSEGYLVYCLRGTSDDKNTLYCSANGVSEVYDDKVDYYMFSVNDDVPTINVDKTINRVDFSNEINREIRAELNIENMTNIYDFYGFTIMAQIENGELVDPCHFNILSSTHCYEEFNDICKHHEVAIEKSEIKEIFGWNIKKFANTWTMHLYYLLAVLKFIVEYDKLILAICVILAVNKQLFKFNFDNLYDEAITIMSIIVFIGTIIEKAPNVYKRITKIRTTNITGYSYDLFDDYVKKYHEKISKEEFRGEAHYIYEIMALCYYFDAVEDD